MNKKVIIGIILLFAISSFMLGCSSETTDTNNSVTGGVIICGVDYPCGQDDGVCPEDYGATCKVKDPDC